MMNLKKSTETIKKLDARWSVLMTFVWSFFAFLLTQVGVSLGVFVYHFNKRGLDYSIANAQNMKGLSDVMMQTVVFGCLVMVLLLPAIVWLKKGSHLAVYLPFKGVEFSDLFKWFVVSIGVAFFSKEFFEAFSMEASPAMGEILAQTQSIVWVYVALVLAAPLSEELLFRGFMISGLERINLPHASSIAVFVSAILWAGIHTQYRPHEIIQIFLLGLVFGYARVKTKSLVTPIVLHVLNNLMAAVLLVGW